jgi:hypothetical protein
MTTPESMYDILILAFVFFTSFLWHEFCHCIEVYRQGYCDYSVYYNFAKLSTYTKYGYIRNLDKMHLAGGVYCSIPLFLLSVISVGIWQFSFMCMGWVQLVYGYAEYHYNGNIMQRDRLVLYSVVILANLLVWGWLH